LRALFVDLRRVNINKKKKILILYSTAGMGHKKAAFALLRAFRDRGEDLDVEILDALEYANSAYRFLYLDFYVFMMSKAKWLWWVIYYLSDRKFMTFLFRKLWASSDYQSLPGFGELLLEKSPDAIVATHFFLPTIADILKTKKGLSSRLYTVVTDYGPHICWLSDHIDRFFVGSESAMEEMIKRGVSDENVSSTGIPTDEKFQYDFDTESIRKEYGLDPHKKTVFLMSGGFGVGPMEEMLLSLNSCAADIQVIAVCGYNKKAYENIAKISKDLKYTLVEFGFTDKIAELMSVSDLMITKPGGISITEAMNMHLPMILFGAVPGQETWNEKFLLDHHAALKAFKMEDIPGLVDEILLSDEKYAEFKAGVDSVRKPDAAHDIADQIVKEIKE